MGRGVVLQVGPGGAGFVAVAAQFNPGAQFPQPVFGVLRLQGQADRFGIRHRTWQRTGLNIPRSIAREPEVPLGSSGNRVGATAGPLALGRHGSSHPEHGPRACGAQWLE